MTAIKWKSGVNGDWATAADWTGGIVPGAADDVTIDASGNFTVTIDSAEAAHSLTLNSANAIVADYSTLTIGSTLSVAAGTFQLNGGLINGGTLSATGGKFAWNGGTLSGCTFIGLIDLSANDSGVSLTNGVSLIGTGGSTGPGTINDTGYFSYLNLSSTETIANAEINLGNARGSSAIRIFGGGVVTLGSTATISHTGHYAEIGGTGTIINTGSIVAGLHGGRLTIDPTAFVNAGSISLSNFDFFGVQLGTSFANTGAVIIGGYGDLSVNGTFTNTGTITVGAAGLLLQEEGSFTNFTSISGTSGAVLYFAMLNNTAGTLNVEAGVTLVGTIAGGEIEGLIDLSRPSNVCLTNGVSLTGAGGIGPGAIADTGFYSRLYLTSTETLTNTRINLGNPQRSSAIKISGGGVVTLGSSVTITHAGALAELGGAGTMVNAGTIIAGSKRGRLTIDTTAFINAGSISVSNIDSIDVTSGTSFTNAGAVVIGDGTVGGSGNFTNTGTIMVGDDGHLDWESVTSTNIGAISATPGAALYFATLDNAGGTLNVGAGVTLGGTIAGGEIQGLIDLSAASSRLALTDGVVLTGAGGKGSGAINDTGYGGALYLTSTETITNTGINLGESRAFHAASAIRIAGGGVVTLGATATITHTGLFAELGGAGTMVNAGSILAGRRSGRLTIDPTAFVNVGSISVSNSDYVYAKGGSTFTNFGAIDVASGGFVVLAAAKLTNLSGTTLTGGRFEVNAGATLIMGGKVVTDDATIVLSGANSVFLSSSRLDDTLGTIGTAGVLEILSGRNWSSTVAMTNAGTLQLGGGTFAPAKLHNNGVLSGFGTIATSLTNTGTLSVQGSQTMSLVGGTLTNLSGTTLTGGTIAVGAGATLQLANNTSVATLAATIDLNGAGSVVQGLNTGKSTEVTLESSLTAIAASGVLGVLAGRNYSATGAIANAGVIQLGGGTFASTALTDAAGSTLSGFGTVASTFRDSGVVTSVGGALSFSGTGDVFAAALSGTEIDFTGGTDALNTGAALSVVAWSIGAGAAVSVNENLTYGGAFSEDATSGVSVAAGAAFSLTGAATLAGVVNGAGALNLASGTISVLTIGGTLALSDTGTVTQTGAVTLGDATGAAASLTVAAGATWTLDGDVGIALGKSKTSALTILGTLSKSAGTDVARISPKTTDNGLIEAAAGTLDLAGNVVGAGALKIDAGATLELAETAAKTLTVTFDGAGATLEVGKPSKMAATISGFASGETIDLLKTAATGASVNDSDQLVVVDGSKTVATLQLSGNYVGQIFSVGSDGKGGSTITLNGPGGVPPALFAQTLAAFGGGGGEAAAHATPSPEVAAPTRLVSAQARL